MELILRNGDYVPGEWGAFQTTEGAGELLERVLFKLNARRGGFPLLPDLGSRLYRLPSLKESERGDAARLYVAEALADEPELEITGVDLQSSPGGGHLRVELLWHGQPLTAETEVGRGSE